MNKDCSRFQRWFLNENVTQKCANQASEISIEENIDHVPFISVNLFGTGS